jgi:hypothetical protein
MAGFIGFVLDPFDRVQHHAAAGSQSIGRWSHYFLADLRNDSA